jgi:hypothetical protein
MGPKPGDELIPVACDLGAFDPVQEAEHRRLLARVSSAVLGRESLPDGYALRYPQDPEMLLDVARFVALERDCCPFFTFTIVMEPPGGSLWLRLTGPSGTKDIVDQFTFPAGRG